MPRFSICLTLLLAVAPAQDWVARYSSGAQSSDEVLALENRDSDCLLTP